MKTLRKTKKCLNCGQDLSEVYDYCPLCGQENTDNNVSFKQLIGDFFSNYFSIDSKFIRSIKPFLVQPGVLTNSFNEGKRKSYANPVRLYIIISFFYFFILSFLASDFAEGMKPSEEGQEKLDSLEVAITNQLDSANLAKVTGDSLLAKTIKDQVTIRNQAGDDLVINANGGWPLTVKEWKTYYQLKDNKDLTVQQIFDSLHVDYKSAFEQRVISQIIRVNKTETEYLFAFVIKNFSIMMFLMLPVFALILKLLYTRRKILYINHLVHTIHIHAFAFLIYGIALAIAIWVIEADWINVLALLWVTIYSYISFKTVYNQSNRKTFAKFILTGMIYSFTMTFAFIIEIFISFLIF